MGDVRKDFPIMQRKINGKKLVYLDSAATSQKPKQVIHAIKNFYEQNNANIHRGLYALSQEATELYEGARKKVASFINATPQEIVFVRNATEGINLVANSWGNSNLKKGDTILLTEMEHHSNIVPWQLLARRTGAVLVYVPVLDDGSLDIALARKLLAKHPKLFAFTHVSNVLGTINPAKELIAEAKKNNVAVLLDACQSVPHMPVDVKDLDADFLVFSGHKMLGPTGIGVLYARKELLEKMEPFLGGGDMIKEVALQSSSWNDVPWKFEAGTPNIAGVIGLGAAVDYLQAMGMAAVRKHEKELAAYALKKLQANKHVKILGTLDPEKRGGVIAFNLGDMHAHDVTSVLDEDGICIRSGHHCALPLIRKFGLTAAARASFYIYTANEDIDALCDGLDRAVKVFKL